QGNLPHGLRHAPQRIYVRRLQQPRTTPGVSRHGKWRQVDLDQRRHLRWAGHQAEDDDEDPVAHQLQPEVGSLHGPYDLDDVHGRESHEEIGWTATPGSLWVSYSSFSEGSSWPSFFI